MLLITSQFKHLQGVALVLSWIMLQFVAFSFNSDYLIEPETASLLWGRSNSSTFRLSQSNHLELIRRSIPEISNKSLTVCVVVREPFVIFKESPEFFNLTNLERRNYEANLENYSGVAIEVVKRLKSIFKFNIRITKPVDNQFGILQAGTGQWTGLMGVLHRRQADIGVTALSITLSRSRDIDFTRAYHVETAAILVRTPEEVKNYSAIFEPFSFTVWLVLLATILLLILLITIMTKLEDNQLDQERRHKMAKLLPTKAADLTMASKNPDNESSGRQLQRLSNSAPLVEDHEYGESWLERFYYAVTCVLNILLIRGEY